MLTQSLPHGRHIGVVLFRQREVQFDEVAQVEAGLVFIHPVIVARIISGSLLGIASAKVFLIGKQLRALDIIEQRTEQDIG